MKEEWPFAPGLVALGIIAIALYSFFVLPGHTYLVQDTQIYVPILENLWDPSVLTHDLLVSRSHVAFVLYDEFAIAIRWLTRASFASILQTTQMVCRALGIFGVYLIALSILRHRLTSLAVAAVLAMGSEVWGPAVLVVELEPSPRAFAIPLVFLAAGLVAHARFRWAALVAAVAFLFHPTSALPFWLCFAALRKWKIGFVSLISAAGILAVTAYFEPGLNESHLLFSRIPPELERIQRARAVYNWIGMWIGSEWPKYLACLAVGSLAYMRLRHRISPLLRPFLIGLPLLGLVSIPVSYLLLDQFKWAVIPQIQPARTLLFTIAVAILLSATAAFHARRSWEAPLWLALALVPAIAGPRPRVIGGPALSQLTEWAQRSTSKDAVFLFVRPGKSLEPGRFRSQALRAVYVDWKGGGQANFLPELGLEWWKRFQDVMVQNPSLDHFRTIGADYVVFPGNPYKVVKVSSR